MNLIHPLALILMALAFMFTLVFSKYKTGTKKVMSCVGCRARLQKRFDFCNKRGKKIKND